MLLIGFEPAFSGKILKKLDKELKKMGLQKLQNFLADIGKNAGEIGNNALKIQNNANDTAINSANIISIIDNVTSNANDILSNADNIASNANDISSNANDTAINSANIISIIDNVDSNTNDILSNADNIVSIANDRPEATRCSAANWGYGCCTPDDPCSINQGECKSDADCHGDLKCGNDNCKGFSLSDGCQGPNDVQVNGVCYYIEEQLLSNTEAIANCHDAFGKGKLFEPRDKETHDSVVAAALEISSQMYWLGISDALSEGHFQYLSGGNITFSNWRAGEPFDVNNEDCALIYTDGKWIDVPCNGGYYSIGSICEVGFTNATSTDCCELVGIDENAEKIDENAEKIVSHGSRLLDLETMGSGSVWFEARAYAISAYSSWTIITYSSLKGTGALNSGSGKFTAPLAGTYQFIIQARKYKTVKGALRMILMDGSTISYDIRDEDDSAIYRTMTGTTIITMQPGQTAWAQTYNTIHYVTFTGVLINPE